MAQSHSGLVATVVAVLAAFVLGAFAVAQFTDRGGDSGAGNGIVATGTGTVSAVPDHMQFTVGVRVRAPQVAGALKQANDLMTKVTKAVTDAGVDPANIQTADVSVDPNWVYRDDSESIDGYWANQTLTVKAPIEIAGKAMGDAAAAAGNNATISGSRMVLEDNDAPLQEARAAAIKDARKAAEQYAKAADVDLGRLVFVEDIESTTPPPIPYAAEMARSADSMDVPVSPGESNVVVRVTTRWSVD